MPCHVLEVLLFSIDWRQTLQVDRGRERKYTGELQIAPLILINEIESSVQWIFNR